MSLLFLLLSLSGSARGSSECPEPDALLDQAEQALVNLQIASLPTILEQLESAWSCSPVAEAEDLSRAWLVEAAYLQLQGQKVQADYAWRAAAAISPTTWNPLLGDSLRGDYEAASAGAQSDPAELSLEIELPRSLELYLDGQARGLPAMLQPGPHLVQAIDGHGLAQAAHLVQLAPAESVQLELGQFSTAPPQVRARWRLAMSGGMAGLAAGSALMARAQDQAMNRAETQDALDEAYARQKGFAVATYGLGSLALAGMTTWFIF